MASKTKSKETASADDQSSLQTHGRTFKGTVIAARMQKTATVEWDRRQYVPKYERYAIEKSRVKAHNPESIDAKKGDIVRIKECRPLSKTKNFVITEIIGQDLAFMAREELLQEARPDYQAEKEEKSEEEGS